MHLCYTERISCVVTILHRSQITCYRTTQSKCHMPLHYTEHMSHAVTVWHRAHAKRCHCMTQSMCHMLSLYCIGHMAFVVTVLHQARVTCCHCTAQSTCHMLSLYCTEHMSHVVTVHCTTQVLLNSPKSCRLDLPWKRILERPVRRCKVWAKEYTALWCWRTGMSAHVTLLSGS